MLKKIQLSQKILFRLFLIDTVILVLVGLQNLEFISYEGVFE